jgi:hypothetical protein
MPDPAKSNAVDMMSKIQILSRAMGVSVKDTFNPTTGMLTNRITPPVDEIIANYKKLYAALVEE